MSACVYFVTHPQWESPNLLFLYSLAKSTSPRELYIIPGGISQQVHYIFFFSNKKWFNDRSRIVNIHFLIRLEEQLKNSLFVLILPFLLLSLSL